MLFRGSLKSGGRVQEEGEAQNKLGVSIQAKKATSLLVIKGEKERKPCWTFLSIQRTAPRSTTGVRAVKIHVPSRDCLPLGSSE